MTERKSGTVAGGIAVVGLGSWGNSLAHALAAAHAPLREVVTGLSSPPPAKRRSAKYRLPLTTLEEAWLDAEIVWLCVPDAAIAATAKRLAARAHQLYPGPRPLQGRIVAHSSGALAAAVLAPAAKAGAAIASVHPVMTFPTRVPVSLSGVFFGVEADPPARRKLYRLIRRLRGQPFAIAGPSKAFYHAMGMLSSPLLASLLAAAEEAGALSGLAPAQARRLTGSIAAATLRNISAHGLYRSFSGPIARGDVETIHLHLGALKEHPMLAEVYRALALYSLKALPARGGEAVRRALDAHSTSQIIEHTKNAGGSRGRRSMSRMRN